MDKKNPVKGSELKRQPETLLRERLNKLNQFSGDKGEVNSSRGRDVKRPFQITTTQSLSITSVYGKRKTSDSSLEFFKIENKRIKTAQNNSYG